MYATHCHDLFYITVKYHDYIPKGIQFTERTQICIRRIKGEKTQKVIKRELSCLYVTHRDDLFYITLIFFVVALVFYVHGKHLRSCRDGQLT